MARMAVIVLILWMCLPEVLSAGVVLEAGEIDSSKVRVGAFAEVVYGKGERDPISGEWEKLVTASGYIKAVDAKSLTLALRQGLGKKRIAFARIQKLLLAKSSRDMERLRKTTDMELPFARTDAGSWRSKGRRIRIHTRGMEEGIVARVYRATRDTLFLKRRIREKRPASIALTDISRLEVYKYRESLRQGRRHRRCCSRDRSGTGRPPRGRSASPDPISHATDYGSYGRCPRRLDARSRCLAGRRSVAIHR